MFKQVSVSGNFQNTLGNVQAFTSAPPKINQKQEETTIINTCSSPKAEKVPEFVIEKRPPHPIAAFNFDPAPAIERHPNLFDSNIEMDDGSTNLLCPPQQRYYSRAEVDQAKINQKVQQAIRQQVVSKTSKFRAQKIESHRFTAKYYDQCASP
jgi:hypothetical protein